MRLAALPLLLAPLFIAPLASAASNLSVCTEASPEGFDVVQYNSLTTTNASADVLMNRLVDYDAASGKLVPSLADSWEVSPDGLTYTFKLHPDVKFHRTDYFVPSRSLTAEDVRFSFERMLDPANPWHKIAQSGFPHAQSLQLPTLVKKIDALDPLTVRFTLDHADSTFLAALSMGFASKHRVLGFEALFQGTIDGAVVYPRQVVKRALAYNAAALILCHNHPSGSVEPSAADRKLTKILQKALEVVDVRVLDHIIVGDGDPLSMAEYGWM